MKAIVFVFAVIMLVAVQLVFSAGPSPVLDGDITIDASSEADVPCADCPGGTGTRLTYDVTLAANAENQGGQDFHIEVNDARASNFGCFNVEKLSPQGQWEDASWDASHESQVEGKRNVHYLSFYQSPFGGQTLSKGETFRFSFVYCGSRNNLDDSIEFIVTDDANALPAVPDAQGDRSDVPDSAGTDDPAWKGKSTKAPGSNVGFVSCPTGEEMTCSFQGIPQPGQIVSWTCQLGDPSSVSPNAIAQILLSVSGTDILPLPAGPAAVCLTPDAITSIVLSLGPVFQAPIVAGFGSTPPFPWPNVPPGFRIYSAGVALDLQLQSIPFASPTIEILTQ